MTDDRAWIETEYLPNLRGKILFVGVAEYTMNYSSLIPQTSIWNTIDVDPTRRDRKASKHFVGNLLDLEFKEKYDHVSLYGLWGQRHSQTNDVKEIKSVLEKADKLTLSGGTIMAGPSRKDIFLTKTQRCNIFSFLYKMG
jgi:hypothetical protein